MNKRQWIMTLAGAAVITAALAAWLWADRNKTAHEPPSTSPAQIESPAPINIGKRQTEPPAHAPQAVNTPPKPTGMAKPPPHMMLPDILPVYHAAILNLHEAAPAEWEAYNNALHAAINAADAEAVLAEYEAARAALIDAAPAEWEAYQAAPTDLSQTTTRSLTEEMRRRVLRKESNEF